MKKAAKSKSGGSKKAKGGGGIKPKGRKEIRVIEDDAPVVADTTPEIEPATAVELPVEIEPAAEEPTEAEAPGFDASEPEMRTVETAEELVPLSEVLKPKRAKAPKANPASPKPMSCLDAAAAVLKDKGIPMRCKDLIDAMAAAGLWKSNAPTPAATLSSAIQREITVKGASSRFQKTDRGLFGLATNH